MISGHGRKSVSDEFDLIVIGGGSAGLTASDFAAKLGLKVALVEKTVWAAIALGLVAFQARRFFI